MSLARKIESFDTRQLDHRLTDMLSAQASRPNCLEVCPPSLPNLAIPTRNASHPWNDQLTLAPTRLTYNSIEVKDISLVDYINVQHAVYVRKSYIAQLGGIPWEILLTEDERLIPLVLFIAPTCSPHRRPIRQEAVRQGPYAHRRASRQLVDDERKEQRKEALGRQDRRPRFRDHPLVDRPEPHPGA